ncbi:conjugative relaxase domain protein [mine drainage metagenome]|uniref:Conjugative relaxase domain protein n=1 Tax=mine drainage metagenome TaxID=410659 RepID=T1ADH2_9ZZZZ
MTEREAVMRAQDLHREAARAAEGRCAWADVEAAINDAARRGELIATDDGRITTSRMLEIERTTDARLEEGRGAHRAVMTSRQFDSALAKFERSQGFALSDEQRAASKMILTNSDRYQGCQGLAGTGKTTMLKFVREAAEGAGWRVAGHSSGAEQAAVMQKESGIASTTTAAWLLEAERAPIASRDERVLYIMDEASQAGAKQYLNSIIATEKLGGRAVLLGDKFQHQSVEAGRAFARSQSHMPMSTLGVQSIRRQRTSHAQWAVQKILSGDHASAVRGLKTLEVRDRQAALPGTATRQDRREAARADNAKVIQRLAADYVALSPAQRARTLIVTSTNADRQAINQEIRARMAVLGELGKSTDVVTLRKTDLTRAELTRASSYTPGQVVEVQNDYRRAQLARGAQFMVIDTTGDCLRIRDAEGQDRMIDPSAIRLQAYEKGCRALAVGERVRWTENHRCARADRPSEEGLKVRNGSGAVVEQISNDGSRITLRSDASEQIQIDARAGVKLDHTYSMTSYAAQGATVDRVLIHHNTESGAHGDRESYVAITRARDDIAFYTQDSVRAAWQSGIALDKASAHDIFVPDIDPSPSPDRDRQRTRERSPEWCM